RLDMKSKLGAALAFLWLIVVAAGLSALGAAQSTADTIYTYTGNPFTGAVSPYTTNDFISRTFYLATSLGNNFPLPTIPPISFSFSDVVQMIMNTTPGVQITTFQVQTDSSGNPDFWFIAVAAGTHAITTCALTPLNPCQVLGTARIAATDFAQSAN